MMEPELVIAIPAYNEEHLPITLASLQACSKVDFPVLILTCINYSEADDTAIKHRAELQFKQFDNQFRAINKRPLEFQFILSELPAKDAGVGLARKVLVDHCQEIFGKTKPELPIVSLDADCTVASNYLKALHGHFTNNPKSPAAAIYFEHNLDIATNKEAIVLYELFLRYYIQGLRLAGYPWAYHTIGSAMAVRLGIYNKQGGMNRRKAGEDFYLLNKIIPLGGFTEVNTTVVYPSSRRSARVPFGTGRAMLEWDKNPEKLHYTYHPGIFHDLKTVFDAISKAEKIKSDLLPSKDWPAHLLKSMDEMDLWKKYENACENSSNINARYQRLWRSLDLFTVRKWVHWLRDEHWGTQEIVKAAESVSKVKTSMSEAQLMILRQLQRNDSYYS